MAASNRPKTILTCYYRPKPGGFCKRLFRAISALLDRGHTVHYLAVVPFPIDHPNCHFHRFPWPKERTFGYLFWGIFHFVAPAQLLYLAFRYHVERLFAFGHNYGLMLQPVRLLKRIPLSVFLRADTIENHRIKGRPGWLITLEHLLEGLGIAGTRMYGVSETLSKKTTERHKLLKPIKIGVLRNDIICSPVVKEQRATRKRRPPFHLACVGVLEPRKNQRFLLEVMKGIEPGQAQLYLYGTGPEEQDLMELVQRERLTDRVHFMGWVEAERIWSDVDLLLMPSLHEGAPNAVLEALGNGVPVLASDIPEHREILSRGLLPCNSAKWISCILQKINNSGLCEKDIIVTQKVTRQEDMFNWGERICEYVTNR